MLKKILCLSLAALLLLGSLGGCTTQPAASDTTPATTEAAVQKPIHKVLTIGHSLAVNSGHMLALVAKAEGYESLTVGTLYYSGCPLYLHVQYLQNDSREYQLYTSSTDDVSAPPSVMNAVTMKDAIRYQDWDLIVMQGGVFEVAEDKTFTDGNIQTIQQYVNANKLNKDAVFAWHMFWPPATEDSLRSMYTASANPYISRYAAYDHDRLKLYNAFTKAVQNYILPDETFKMLIPTGTAIENAMSSYLTEFDLLRDYAHTNDLGRLIAAYTWYCRIAGVEKLEAIKLTTIPKQFLADSALTDRVLTQMEQAIIIESVNNALAQPLQMTQSQYTEAPAA